MVEPVQLQILQNLQTALRAISTGTGYYHDLQPEAVKLDPDADAEAFAAYRGLRPFVVLQPMPETWFYEGMPLGVRLEWPIKIHWVCEPDGTDDDAKATAFFRGCADVERALTRDISRGGLAVDHRVVTQTMNWSEDGLVVWAEIDTRVRVRRLFGAP